MTPLYAGDQLDEYQLESLVASSGMASIFRATDTRDGSAAAIKVPHPEAECDPIFHERFRREMEIGPLSNIPPSARSFRKTTIAASIWPWNGWRAGCSVRSRRRRPALHPARYLDRHGDPRGTRLHARPRRSPSRSEARKHNANADDRIKIMDFGIAANAGSRRLTFGKLSHVMGSPDYISPEQVKNKRGDARSDCTPWASSSTKCSPEKPRSTAPIHSLS